VLVFDNVLISSQEDIEFTTPQLGDKGATHGRGALVRNFHHRRSPFVKFICPVRQSPIEQKRKRTEKKTLVSKSVVKKMFLFMLRPHLERGERI